MAASRLIPRVLNLTPIGLLVLLQAWVVWDLLAVPDRRWSAALSVPIVTSVAFFLLSHVFRRRRAHWIAIVALGSAYVALHAFVLGIQLVSALVFVSLLIAQVETRILSERFAPLFIATITPGQRRQIGDAFLRALIRLMIASILAVVIPLFAADLATAGVVPVTTIPTALLLSAGLVAIVLLIALLPVLEPRTE